MSISSVKTGAIGDSLLAGNAAYIPTNFESIATATGAGTSSITFSSIPSTYQYLQLRWIARTGTTGDVSLSLNVRLNGDTGANYTRHLLYGDASGSVIASGGASETSMQVRASARRNSSSANTMGVAIMDIHDYSSTTKNKTMRSFSGNDDSDGTGEVALCSGLWLNTSAVNSITIFSADNFLTSSVFSLYGIKGA